MYGQPGITGDPLYLVIERRRLPPKFSTMSSRRRLEESGAREKNRDEFYNILDYHAHGQRTVFNHASNFRSDVCAVSHASLLF